MRIARHVEALTPYTPGEQPKNRAVIKLNTNENPYRPTSAIARVLADFDLDRLRRYPDPECTELRARLATLNHTTPERIFVGNGSDEVLALAARAFVEDGEAIGSFDPSYSLYKTLAAIRNVPFVPSPLGPGFSWAEPVTAAGGTPVALFLLTNPNAPTSIRYPEENVRAFAARFPGVVLVDEAYVDFAEHDCMALATAPDATNVLVMRTFSKSFSLAGLRVGYCVGPAPLIEALYKIKDSYNVDALAQAVATAALDDVATMRTHAARVVATRTRVTGALRGRGWDVPASQTNFLFARPPAQAGTSDPDARAAALFAALRARDIFVRYFPGPGTGDRLRITIGTEAEMDAFLATLDALES